jgi:hypothetical protein
VSRLHKSASSFQSVAADHADVSASTISGNQTRSASPEGIR